MPPRIPKTDPGPRKVHSRLCGSCGISKPAKGFKEHQRECTLDETLCVHCNESIITRFMNEHLLQCARLLPECAICMEEIKQRYFLPCCHYYHENCIAEWARRKPECPQCMHPIKEQIPQPKNQLFQFQQQDSQSQISQGAIRISDEEEVFENVPMLQSNNPSGLMTLMQVLNMGGMPYQPWKNF